MSEVRDYEIGPNQWVVDALTIRPDCGAEEWVVKGQMPRSAHLERCVVRRQVSELSLYHSVRFPETVSVTTGRWGVRNGSGIPGILMPATRFCSPEVTREGQ